MSRLPDLLSPERIAGLEDEMIEMMAMETDASASERAEVEDRLRSAETARMKLNVHIQTRRPGWLFPHHGSN